MGRGRFIDYGLAMDCKGDLNAIEQTYFKAKDAEYANQLKSDWMEPVK